MKKLKLDIPNVWVEHAHILRAARNAAEMLFALRILKEAAIREQLFEEASELRQANKTFLKWLATKPCSSDCLSYEPKGVQDRRGKPYKFLTGTIQSL